MLSIANLDQLPLDQGIEIAFVGRSNAGKSSVLNKLTQHTQLARVSKTPGRTQLINLFDLTHNRRIADLPGYGYAKVPADIKKQWQKLLDAYLRSRDCLQGLILVMDIRHPLKEFDKDMLNWCTECHLPIHILLNKADKLTPGAAKKTLLETSKAIATYPNTITLQTFSAVKGTGLDELKRKLDEWYSITAFQVHAQVQKG
ncbi:MAG: engB [Gammaproteobacteria bacterium]|nr:engB [Gammaproteobacteria bacterium]